jgi:hypothetical protein
VVHIWPSAEHSGNRINLSTQISLQKVLRSPQKFSLAKGGSHNNVYMFSVFFEPYIFYPVKFTLRIYKGFPYIHLIVVFSGIMTLLFPEMFFYNIK